MSKKKKAELKKTIKRNQNFQSKLEATTDISKKQEILQKNALQICLRKLRGESILSADIAEKKLTKINKDNARKQRQAMRKAKERDELKAQQEEKDHQEEAPRITRKQRRNELIVKAKRRQAREAKKEKQK